jgi:ferric-dicitrate binding protein FerR (iron transport regulator)
MKREELISLIQRFLDGQTTAEEAALLSRELESSEESRKSYLQLARLHAMLAAEEADPAVEVLPTMRARRAPLRKWPLVAVAAAAAVAIGLLIDWPTPRGASEATGGERETVAEFVDLRDCRWVAADTTVQPGDSLRRGQRVELSSGSAVLRFTSGALVTLLGPCIFEATSGNGAFLTLGQIKARADTPASKGFTVNTRTAQVVDVGTEFVTAVAPDGQSRVDVTSGEVYVLLDGMKSRHRLREGEAFSVEPGQAQVMVRIERGDGTAAFRFSTIEPPSERDYADRSAGHASIRLVRGALRTVSAIPSGAVELLLDGRGQSTQDSPAESVFLDNNAAGALLLDLGRTVSIAKINTFSWHQDRTPQNRVRAVQKFTLYGHDGETPPAIDGDLEQAGWRQVARVNSDDFFRVMQPIDRPAQQACSITGARGGVGRYRYLLWAVEPTQSINPLYLNNTFYAEFDVYAEP